MSNTPNHGIPYVPEGTLDPAAGLNSSLNTIDALIQCAAIDFLSTPPVSPDDGDLYIVAPTGTGLWSGYDNRLVRYVADGDFWQSFVAGSQVIMVLNLADGTLYKWVEDSSGGQWENAAGVFDAPVDGLNYVRKDGAWQELVIIERVVASWVDGSGDALTTAVGKVDCVIPFDGVIVGARIVTTGSLAGSCTIDIWRDQFSFWPPTLGDSILDSTFFGIVSGSKETDDTLTGWDTTVNADDVLRFTLADVAEFTGVFVTLYVKRL